MYNLLGSQAKRRDAKRVLDVAQIEKGLALYFDKTGAYPVFTGCIDGKALDTVTSGLRKNDLLPATVTISDSQNPSNPRSCYYYIGLASRYSLRYTLETTSSAGIAGDHLDRL